MQCVGECVERVKLCSRFYFVFVFVLVRMVHKKTIYIYENHIQLNQQPVRRRPSQSRVLPNTPLTPAAVSSSPHTHTHTYTHIYINVFLNRAVDDDDTVCSGRGYRSTRRMNINRPGAEEAFLLLPYSFFFSFSPQQLTLALSPSPAYQLGLFRS
eukprot:gene1804-1094_t